MMNAIRIREYLNRIHEILSDATENVRETCSIAVFLESILHYV